MKIKTIALVALLCCTGVRATEIIYTPISPTFGGNPLNGTFLLSKANAQNAHTEDRSKDFVQRFKESLERNILSQITRKFAEGKLNEGIFDAGDYKITVVDLGGGRFEVTILNELTGETTVIEMFNPGIGL